MATTHYHLQESGKAFPGQQRQIQPGPGICSCGKQGAGHDEWTFQTLLSAAAGTDEQYLFECISRIEVKIRECEKILQPPHPRRTQVLAGLRSYVESHGRHLTRAQIRKYRKSAEGRQAAMIYQSQHCFS